MGLFSFTNVAISLVTLFVVRRIYWEATTGARHRAIARRHGCLPPKPMSTSWSSYILGIDLLIAHLKMLKAHRLLEGWTKGLRDKDAHTVSMDILGEKVFLTDDPENTKALLATDFDVWSLGQDRIKQMSAFLGHGIFTTEGAAWKHSRDMLRPCFERSQVADVSMFEKHTNRLIDILPKDGTTVDLQPLFHDLTLDIATEFLFDQSTDALLDRERTNVIFRDFVESFDYCTNPLENENKKYGILGMFLPDPKFKICAKKIQAFAQNLIEKQMVLRSKACEGGAPSTRYVFLDELLSATQNLSVIRSELLNILLAGRDTTASLLSNVLWELSRQPKILARLRHEIVEHIGDELPSYEQLKEMKYLKAIINESQRMYPIVPSNSRQALKDTTIPRGGGPDGKAPVFVPKGAYVSYHSYAMHRRSDVYGADANIFDPTRWLAGEHPSSPLRPGWAYIPFSGGPRICIGQNFALTEAMFVVVRLLQTFDIESHDSEPWAEKLTVTCTGKNGCRVGLKPRA